MSNFIMDCGDKIFAEVTRAALKKRGVEWIDFGDAATIHSHSRERCLIISSLTNSCDVNSDSFEELLALEQNYKGICVSMRYKQV